ncbi:tetratricopeptide repeat protein [Candidatus Latescibacterota bacterium]
MIVSGLIYLLLHAAASLSFAQLMWGVDSWRYLPPGTVLIFLLLGLLSFLPLVHRLLKPKINILGHVLSRIPSVFWLPIGAVVFYVLRQKTFFLGDGLLRITNTEANYLFSFEEPLDTLLHNIAYDYLHSFFNVSGKEIYQWISILVGVIALWGLLYYSRDLFKNSGERWFIGLLVALTGTVQLFFGYVESYTIVNCLILLFLLSSLLMLKRERMTVVPVVFLSLAVISHPVGAMFLPGAVYAYYTVISKPRTGARKYLEFLLPAGIFSGVVIALLIVFWISGITPLAFIKHYLRGSNILPLFSTGDLYGILSLYHLIDIANEIGLIIPSIIALSYIGSRFRLLRLSDSILFLLLCTAGMLFFMSTFNPKLGYSRDWDIFALTAFPVTLLLGMLILDLKEKNLFSIAFPLILISFIHTGSWIWVNSSESVSRERFEFLASSFWWTDSARGMAEEVLGSYYFEKNNLEEYLIHWEKAYELTGNTRYFDNIARTLWYLDDLEKLREFVEKDGSLAVGHFSLGSVYLSRKMLDEAEDEFKKVLAINPEYPEVHFKLGIIYTMMGRYDDAISENLEAARHTDKASINYLIYNNLGYAYMKKNNIREAKKAFSTVIRLKPDESSAHYSLAYIYYHEKNESMAKHHAELARNYGKDSGEVDAFLKLLEQSDSESNSTLDKSR